MERSRYDSDLSDEQWDLIEPIVVKQFGRRGRPRRYEAREIVNALLFVVHTHCPWRQLPPTLPPWPTVYDHYRRLEEAGKLDAICRIVGAPSMPDAIRSHSRSRTPRSRLPRYALW